jgi:hypothetical protein
MCGRQVRMRPTTAIDVKDIVASVSDQTFASAYVPSTGILQLDWQGFPNNSPSPAPAVTATVAGPGGYNASVPYNVYDDLAPGTYIVTWRSSTFQYNGTSLTYTAAPTTINVPESSVTTGCPTAVTATASYGP